MILMKWRNKNFVGTSGCNLFYLVGNPSNLTLFLESRAFSEQTTDKKWVKEAELLSLRPPPPETRFKNIGIHVIIIYFVYFLQKKKKIK